MARGAGPLPAVIVLAVLGLAFVGGICLVAFGAPQVPARVQARGVASAGVMSAAGGDTSVPLGLVVVGASLLTAIAFTAGYFIIPRGGVDEVFLVHDSGLLLVHFSKTLRPEKDRDVLVGMLTVVQTFVKDAFSKGPGAGLREMDFGDRKLLICKGSYGYLAVLIQGRAPLGMARRMRAAIAEVEGTYRQAIAGWDGSTDALSGADDILVAILLAGRLKQLRKDVRTVVRRVRAWFAPRHPAAAPAPSAPGRRATATDPRESARALLRRPELQSFRPEYRDMMSAALQQIEEGRFRLTGLANVYMTMAMQKSPQAAVIGWWNLVLRTVREVLWTWPWTPASQAWVLNPGVEAAAVPAEVVPAPLEAPYHGPAVTPPGISASAFGALSLRKPRQEPADSP